MSSTKASEYGSHETNKAYIDDESAASRIRETGNTDASSYGNVQGGFKAAAHNPRFSEETRKNAERKLEEMGSSVDAPAPSSAPSDDIFQGKDHGSVLRGYKATLKNPNVSQQAKDNARRILEENDAL